MSTRAARRQAIAAAKQTYWVQLLEKVTTVGQFFEKLNECGTYFAEAEYLKHAPPRRSARRYSNVAKPQVKSLFKRQDATAPPTNPPHSMANIQEIEILSNNGHFSHFLNAAVVPAANERCAPTGSNGGTEEFGLTGKMCLPTLLIGL